jgi:hypothetical protein
MVIMNIVWWMNMQMYDAFWYLLLMCVDELCMVDIGCIYG